MRFLNRHVADVPARRFALAADEMLLLNPNTGTLPVFRSRRDAEITLACYRRHPVLIRDGARRQPLGPALRHGCSTWPTTPACSEPPTISSAAGADFDGWAWQRGDQRWLPLYEAKMLSHWNHRFSTYAGATQAQLNEGTLPRLTD